jgi:N-acetylglucosamine kinase-like BadF-type ATPase
VGIAVVSGTGANAMGMNAAGKRFRIGGFGPDFGDLGGGTDIGIEALRKAFRSLDGRDQPTLLADLIRQRLRLERLDDLLDLLEPGHGRGFSPALLAPIVFEAAAHWDRAALSILEGAGRELGIAARAVARELFSPDERFVLVMGGSVLQKGKVPVMRDRLRAEVAAEFPHAQPRVLDWKPVAGAVLYALDQVLAAGLADDDACELVRRTLAGCLRCRIGEGTA